MEPNFSKSEQFNGNRVETLKNTVKEYNQLLEEGWKKTSFLEVIFKDKSPLSNALSNNLEDYIHCNSRT